MADIVFYPNACHVCKKYGKTISLKTCGDCWMISYCNKKHQKEHWPQHKPICQAIKHMLDGKKYMNTDEISCWEKWIDMRNEWIDTVSTQLQRSLKKYEKQMFLFPKACIICHRQNELINCRKCPGASVCISHIKEFRHINCKAMRLCFEVDTRKEERIDALKLDTSMKPFVDMRSYLHYYVPYMPQIPRHIFKRLYSEYLTKPLTLQFVMGWLHLLTTGENLVVHVIASRLCDIINFTQWEILFHEVPFLKSITIISIGPNIQSTNYQVENLCDICIKMKRKIVHEYYPMYYRAYVRAEDFKKPHMIVGFNVSPYEFYDKNDSTTKLSEEWMATAQALMEQNCPYILTLLKLPNVMKRKIMKRKECGNYARENPFMSIRPQRSTFCDDNYIHYNNEYLIIYESIQNCLLLVEED